MAVGNGIMPYALNYDTMVPLFYNHALIRQGLYDKVATQCCNSNTYNCDYYGQLDTQPCRDWIIQELRADRGLNPYNLYYACYYPFDSKQSFIKRHLDRHIGIKSDSEHSYAAVSKDTDVPLCAQENATEVYMNRADVRQALNIPSFLPHWTDCSDPVGQAYTEVYPNQINQVNAIVNAGVRVLIYNGDVDSVCNHVSNIQFLAQLNRAVLGANTDINQPWYYRNEIPNTAGYVTRFAGGIDFVTIRGAGHFVPTDKPREALQMIYNFIRANGTDYSRAVPDNVMHPPTTK